MTRFRLPGAVAWLAVAGLAVVEGVRLGVGTPRQPGPGFLPALVGLVLGALAIGLLLAPAGEAASPPVPGGRRRLLAAVGALVAYAVLLEPLGFVPATFLMLWFLLAAVGGTRWPVAVGLAAGIAAAAWLVFDRLLHAQLPRGVLARLGS